MPSNGASSILHRVIEPLDQLKPAAAEALLQMKFTRRDLKRMNDLSALAQQGTLSQKQADELDLYLNLGHLLAILHSKARVALKRHGRTPAAGGRPKRKSA